MTKKPQEVSELMVQTLTDQYTDQGLTQMLHASKCQTNFTSMEEELHRGQLLMWKRNEKSADDVFALRQITKLKNRQDQDLSTLFKIPEFDTWKTYIQLISNDIDVNAVIVQTLASHYTDNGMDTLLLATMYWADELNSWLPTCKKRSLRFG
ncbi:hypothetical protein PsorP6_013898 [Peronosclerospora sorghi]|uniref:Uncharacterized protein n=1 Tax=Peronosclerospora sorghi TaxID=230839 RepID=A0ACC0VIW9_9STRA|nr:hypothetical protein PsorP6_013898 [Peronosclerospora sorghi]